MIDPVPPQLFYIDLDVAAARLTSVSTWLTTQERASASRFSTPELQVRALSSRLFLRAVLACFMQIAPSEIRIDLGPWGKPLVCGGPQFNLSHSGSLAMIALHPHLPVGLDVEADTRSVPGAALSNVLSSSEAAKMPGTERDWLRLWVRKEAVIKAQGLGFHLDPRSFTVGHEPCGTWCKVPATTEVLYDGKLIPGHYVAIALTASRCPLELPIVTNCRADRLISYAAAFT